MWSVLPIIPIVARHSELTRRTSPEGSVICAQPPFPSCQGRAGPGAPANLAAVPWLHLQIMDSHAQRDAPQRHAVADARLAFFAAHDLVARLQALWGQDVGPFAVRVLDQGDAEVRFGSYSMATTVADTLSLRALEIDDAIHAFVAAATEARADDALIVPASLFGVRPQQRLLRTFLAVASSRRNRSPSLDGGRRLSVCIRECP